MWQLRAIITTIVCGALNVDTAGMDGGLMTVPSFKKLIIIAIVQSSW